MESNEKVNGYGVPLGPILVALLIIIFINHIEQILDKCEIIMNEDQLIEE